MYSILIKLSIYIYYEKLYLLYNDIEKNKNKEII